MGNVIYLAKRVGKPIQHDEYINIVVVAKDEVEAAAMVREKVTGSRDEELSDYEKYCLDYEYTPLVSDTAGIVAAEFFGS